MAAAQWLVVLIVVVLILGLAWEATAWLSTL
jgi:hypothetical protein